VFKDAIFASGSNSSGTLLKIVVYDNDGGDIDERDMLGFVQVAVDAAAAETVSAGSVIVLPPQLCDRDVVTIAGVRLCNAAGECVRGADGASTISFTLTGEIDYGGGGGGLFSCMTSTSSVTARNFDPSESKTTSLSYSKSTSLSSVKNEGDVRAARTETPPTTTTTTAASAAVGENMTAAVFVVAPTLPPTSTSTSSLPPPKALSLCFHVRCEELPTTTPADETGGGVGDGNIVGLYCKTKPRADAAAAAATAVDKPSYLCVGQTEMAVATAATSSAQAASPQFDLPLLLPLPLSLMTTETTTTPTLEMTAAAAALKFCVYSVSGGDDGGAGGGGVNEVVGIAQTTAAAVLAAVTAAGNGNDGNDGGVVTALLTLPLKARGKNGALINGGRAVLHLSVTTTYTHDDNELTKESI
jgi:hypothetical protein